MDTERVAVVELLRPFRPPLIVHLERWILDEGVTVVHRDVRNGRHAHPGESGGKRMLGTNEVVMMRVA
jgi:hypothetical protein